jgi:hypothetical protein
MSIKRGLLIVLVASLSILAVTAGPGIGHAARALLTAEEAESQGVAIPYRGRLADRNGQPVADGAYDFAFALHEDESGGEPLWSEVQEGVPVTDGAFVAPLGSVKPIVPDVLGGEERWLAVAVRGPGEAEFTALAPRQHVSVTSPVAPASPTNGGACPHDHFGESWVGSTGGYGLAVSNWGGGDAIFGTSSAPAKSGVYGLNDAGYGVVGRSASGDGVHGIAHAPAKSGVYGLNNAGYGVTGRSTEGFGMFADGTDDGLFVARKGDLLLGGNYGDVFAPGFLRLWTNVDFYVTLDANNDGFASFTIFDGTGGSIFSVNENGDTWAAGSKGAAVKTANHGQRGLYAMESAEVWFEDLGTATLINGEAAVPIEPIFADTVNLEVDYHVFVTPLCREPVLLFVTDKSPDSFTVRGVTLDGQPSACALDYRIVAKRLGFEHVRLEAPAVPAVGGGP